MAESAAGSLSNRVAVAPPSQIRVNLEVAHGDSRLQINENGDYVVHFEGNVHTITTAIFGQFNVQRMLNFGGSVIVICYALHKLGYNAGPFSPGSIVFVVSTEPGRENTIRRRLNNGTFLQELREEVNDILEEHSDILGDLKHFTIISCKEIRPKQENVLPDDVKMEYSGSMLQSVNMVHETVVYTDQPNKASMGPSKGDAEFRYKRWFIYGVRGKMGKTPTCRGCQTRIETGDGRIILRNDDPNLTYPIKDQYHIPCLFLKLHGETERKDNYRYINSIRDIRNFNSSNESDRGLIDELIMDVDGKGKLKDLRKWIEWREQKKSLSQASASNNGDKKRSRKRSNSKISNAPASKTSSINSKIRKLQIKSEVQNEDPLEKEKFSPTEIRKYKADELKTVRGILGSGGFATVRLVFHKSFGMYAIKCMKSSKKEWENMEREIKLLEVGRHDNVLCLRGYTVWRRSCGIIIDYMQGGDLKSLLEMENIQNIKPSLKLRFMSHAASGIRFLHNAQERKRIVHHDLKPENFLLDQNLKLVISDLGGSVLGTKTIGMAGRTRGKENLHHTPIYTAPELFDTFLKTKSNSSSDVYSFAICIHATLTRTMPELGKLTAKEFQEKVKQGDRPHLGDIDALKQNLKEDKVESENVQCLENIMIECWDKEPSARPNMVDVDDRLMKQLDLNKDVQEHANEVYKMMALNSQSQSTQEQCYPLTDFRSPFKDPEKKKKIL